MARVVACAIVRGDDPQVFVAEDQEVLNWVLALQLIARTPGSELDPGLRDQLREAVRDEQWGLAVSLWMQHSYGAPVDVYSSHELYTRRDVELAAHELEFTPLFRD